MFNVPKRYISVKALYETVPKTEKQLDVINGWVRSVRLLKKVAFIDLYDGSTNRDVKVVIKEPEESDVVKSLKTGQCLTIHSPILKLTNGSRTQAFELLVENPTKNLQVLGHVTEHYPLQKKGHSLEFLRTLPTLKYRTLYYGSLLRFRSHMEEYFINFFNKQENMLKVSPPIFTVNDCEGAGEQFLVNSPVLQDKETFLTVSTQLHLEILSTAVSNCWTLSPCFRAEKSATPRHLMEFWMLEAELSFITSLDELISFTKRFLQSIVTQCYENQDSLLTDQIPTLINKPEILLKWEMLRDLDNWKTISYTEAIKILTEQHKKQPFPRYEPQWGEPLQTEHEKWLAGSHFKSPVFVTDYPKDCKAFYMKLNDDKNTVACFDLLVPEMGEIIGGSLREDNYNTLQYEMQRRNMNKDGELDWYLEMRQQGGAPHGGFGLGFERFISYLLGVSNIKDTIPFPRSANSSISL
ncbi:Asparagine--tRNA ligase, mitochondrial [Nakaseomyces bracarensis]|uniref:asparagine--tRNA ligase n=1 Tax=Nakaseomyces bracarensis TaxID=273131 RepID=A0ABR4NYM7_9SACH